MTDSTTDSNAPQDETTHFGYQEVPVNEKHERVAEVFRSVATRYDIMNDVMSLGTHRLIKRFTIELSGLRQGHRVLDLAGGTGDLSMRFSPIVGKEGHVVLADINAAMLEVGRDRIVDRGLQSNITVAQSDAECLPFADNCFDCVCIAYGLRNVTRKEKALESILRVLKPGGYAVVGDVKAYHAYDRYDRWKNDYWNQVHGGDPFWREYADTNLADLALEAGFAEASWEGLGEARYPFVLVARKGN